jgi:hypothetical protein
MAISNSKNPKKKDSKSETITELAHRHLHDEGHTTTDEELRNAKVELTGNIKEDTESLFEVDNTPVTSPLQNEIEKDTDLKDDDKEDDEDRKGDLPNPYTVLG